MLKKYPYLYETHLHTSVGSKCGKSTPEELVEALKAAGYTGAVVTDHNWGGNTAIDKTLPFSEWVDGFEESYIRTRTAGEKLGLDIFWGYEAGFRGTEFLVYGLTPQWLREHPQIREADLQTHLTMVRQAGGTVIHAHPFRERTYIPEVRLFPELVDGVEAFNCINYNAEQDGEETALFDRRAVDYARAYGLPMSAGSDTHNKNLRGGGVAFTRRMADIQDLCRAIRADEDRLLLDGRYIYDKNGQKVGD